MIDFDQVLYADRFALNQQASWGRKENLLTAIKRLFFTTFKFPQTRSAEFLFFRSLIRDDYKKLIHEIASTTMPGDSIIVEDYLRNTRKAAPMAFILLIKLMPIFFSFKATSFYERVFLYLRLCFYFRVIAAISKYDFKTLILFADMQPVECLLAQHFRNKGRRTVTLQHGLYVDYGQYPTVNTINYLHQPSEYFLAWGKHTAELIYRSGSGRKVVICGKPSIAIHAPINKAKIANRTTDLINEKYFTVVLDQNIFQSQNIEMLTLLSEYAQLTASRMNVRYHPGNNRELYEQLGIEYYSDLDLDHSTFIVGHTSSMLHEVMLLGIPALKFNSNIPCVKMPDTLIFSSLGELKDVIQKAEIIDFKSLAKEYIEALGDESLERYRAFFYALRNSQDIVPD